MKANEAPEKIFVNPNALRNSGYNGKNYMFIHDSVFDESKCTIEYIRTDAFIEKAEKYLKDRFLNYIEYYRRGVGVSTEEFIEEFLKTMRQ